MKARKLLFTPLLASLAAALVLAACEKPDEPLAASAALDNAISSVVQTVREVEPGKPGGVGECSGTPGAGTSNADSESQAAASSALRDAVIAVDVADRLAQDPGLSALAIAVDAACGHIALRGTAPDARTRERATQLALVVNGVTAVDNRLALYRGL